MKSCTLVLVALSTLLASFSDLQAKDDHAVTYGRWKEKTLRKAPKVVTLQNYHLIFKTSTFNLQRFKDKVYGPETDSYIDLPPELALEIADAGIEHLKASFAAKGYEVRIFDPEKVKEHKEFKKAFKKTGQAQIFNGAADLVTPKQAGEWGMGDGGFVSVIPHGVNHFWLGPGTGEKERKKVLKDLAKGVDAAGLFVTGKIDFVNPMRKENRASSINHQLEAINKPGIQFVHNGVFTGSTNAGYGKDGSVVWSEFKMPQNENLSWIASTETASDDKESQVANRYTIDPEAFKRVAIDVLKAHAEELVATYDEAFYGK